MKLKDLTESSVPLPTVFYHGTQKKNVDSILQHGLSPAKTKSGQQGIYLTDDLFTAENYGLMHGNEGVILVIETTGLRPSSLGPDDYELPEFLDEPWSDVGAEIDNYSNWSDVPWWKSIEYVNQVIYYKTIRPQYIKLHR